MIRIRPAPPRPEVTPTTAGWTLGTFSFSDYHHPQQMGWGPQRVIHGQPLAAGDGVKIAEEERIELMGGDRGGELPLFELPASG